MLLISFLPFCVGVSVVVANILFVAFVAHKVYINILCKDSDFFSCVIAVDGYFFARLKLFLSRFSPYDSNCKNILIAEKEWLRLFFLMLFFGCTFPPGGIVFFGGGAVTCEKTLSL